MLGPGNNGKEERKTITSSPHDEQRTNPLVIYIYIKHTLQQKFFYWKNLIYKQSFDLMRRKYLRFMSVQVAHNKHAVIVMV